MKIQMLIPPDVCLIIIVAAAVYSAVTEWGSLRLLRAGKSAAKQGLELKAGQKQCFTSLQWASHFLEISRKYFRKYKNKYFETCNKENVSETFLNLHLR